MSLSPALSSRPVCLTGSKAYVDRSNSLSFTSLKLLSWRRALCRYHAGFVPAIPYIQLSWFREELGKHVLHPSRFCRRFRTLFSLITKIFLKFFSGLDNRLGDILVGHALHSSDSLDAHSLHTEQPQTTVLFWCQAASDLDHQKGAGSGAFRVRFSLGQLLEQLVLHRWDGYNKVQVLVRQGEAVVIVAAS